MYKRILIPLIVTTVLAVVAYTVFLFATRSTDDTTNDENLSLATNAATTKPTPVVSGDVAVNKSVTYRDVTFEFETALATRTYGGQQAETGKRFIVLFLKPFSEALASDPSGWVGAEVRLTGTDGLSAQPFEVAIPAAVEQRGGFFSFVVPEDRIEFTLVFGTGAKAQIIALSV